MPQKQPPVFAHIFNAVSKFSTSIQSLPFLPPDPARQREKQIEEAITILRRERAIIIPAELPAVHSTVDRKRWEWDVASVIATLESTCQETYDRALDLRNTLAAQKPDPRSTEFRRTEFRLVSYRRCTLG